MAIYKGFDTTGPLPAQKMTYANSLTAAQRGGLSPSEFVDAWGLGLTPSEFKARTASRERQALNNAHEPDQSEVSAYIQGMGEGFKIGKTGVKKAFIGAGTGLWHVAEDLASNLGAGAHGLADDLTGNIKDERKQVQKSNATYDRMKAAFEGATGSEEGGWLRSLVEAAGTDAGGQSGEALAMLKSIPSDELAGLDPSSPDFSENMAGLGINIALFALAARGSVLKAADNLDAQAAKLNATGVAADATAAAKLMERARIYRRIAALPKYAENARVAGKILASSPKLVKAGRALTAINNFKNPVKDASEAIRADSAAANKAAIRAMKPGGKNTMRPAGLETSHALGSAGVNPHYVFAETVPSSEFESPHSARYSASIDALAKHGLAGDPAVGALHSALIQPDNIAEINAALRSANIHGEIFDAVHSHGYYTDEQGHTSFNANVTFDYVGDSDGAKAITDAWGDIHGQSSVLHIRDTTPSGPVTPGVQFHLPRGYSNREVAGLLDNLKGFKDEHGTRLFEGGSLIPGRNGNGPILETSAHFAPLYHPPSSYDSWAKAFASQSNEIVSAVSEVTDGDADVMLPERTTYSHEGSAQQSITTEETVGRLRSDPTTRHDGGGAQQGYKAPSGRNPGETQGSGLSPRTGYDSVARALYGQRNAAFEEAVTDPSGFIRKYGPSATEPAATYPATVLSNAGAEPSRLPIDQNAVNGLNLLHWLLMFSNIARNAQQNVTPPNAHAVPPSPPIPVGPTRSPSVVAGLRAMRNEAL